MASAHGPVADAVARLTGAGLIPPISAFENVGLPARTVIDVRGEISDELAAQDANALVEVGYTLREVCAAHGINYA
jgi:hypothetical protein